MDGIYGSENCCILYFFMKLKQPIYQSFNETKE